MNQKDKTMRSVIKQSIRSGYGGLSAGAFADFIYHLVKCQELVIEIRSDRNCCTGNRISGCDQTY